MIKCNSDINDIFDICIMHFYMILGYGKYKVSKNVNKTLSFRLTSMMIL